MPNIIDSKQAAEILEVQPYYVPDLMRRHGYDKVGTMPPEGKGRPRLTWRRGDVSKVKLARAGRAKAKAKAKKSKRAEAEA